MAHKTLRCQRLRTELAGVSLCVLGLWTNAVCAAAPGPPPTGDGPPASSCAMELVLEVHLNGLPRGLAHFQWQDGALWASPQVLTALGFRPRAAGSQWQRLDRLAGVTADFDTALQQLHLHVPLELLDLPTTVIDTQARPTHSASSSPGLLLNYDLFATRGRDGASNLSAFTELRAFHGNAVLSSTGLTLRQRGDRQQPWSAESVRLDSTLSYSLPARMVTVRVGDTLTAALPWSRATRIGGLQIARNFGLQPYRATAPLPSFLGSATLPSDVELFINGVRQYSGRVPPGPFQLQALPTINSVGRAQVVLTDALGRSTTLDFPLYDQGRLLAPGLSDWSVDLGWVRRSYGQHSFDYASDFSASGVWRRGISDTLTLEAHGEATQGVTLAGAGAVWQMGAAGLLSGALSRSEHRHGSGSQWHAAYTWRRGALSLGLSGSHTRNDYRDVASQWGSPPPRGVGRASIGYSAAALGSLNLSYLYLRPVGNTASRYASLSWFRTLGGRASLSAGLQQNLDHDKDRGLFINLHWSLGESGPSLSTGIQRDGSQSTALASAQSSTPVEGGWGWRVAARAGQRSGTSGGQAEVSYLGRHGRVQAGLSDFGANSRYGWLGGSGAIVMMGRDAWFAARRIDDAFAVVSTDGVAEVPVKLENRTIGHTDARGLLLVVPVNAYQDNRLAIDPMRLPADVRIDHTEAIATPADRAGVRVRFAIAPARAANVQLVDGNGAPLPLGSRIAVVGSAHAPARVGHDGMAYLENLQESNMLEVQSPQGLCRVPLHWQRDAQGALPHIGPLRCIPVGTTP